MYACSDLTIRQVAASCGVTAKGLMAHIGRFHRKLLFARYGLDFNDPALAGIKVKAPVGQSHITYLKYKDAVEACGDPAYIELNVSQIARIFGLTGPALAAQLRVHYPDVMPARERLRHRLGLADNARRGPRPLSDEQYADALELYAVSDLTIGEVADRCGVSAGSLSQYMRSYHHDVIAGRARSRREAVASRVNVSAAPPRSPRPATADKYRDAIETLRTSGCTVAEAAARHGHNADVFRIYVRAHHPELLARPASEKYAEALRRYTTSASSLRSIAADCGLSYKSLAGYVRRNCPGARAAHDQAALSATALPTE